MKRVMNVIVWSCFVWGWTASVYGSDSPPYLRPQGTGQQLIVEGRPFLMLGGELGNSSASSLSYIDSVWETLVTMHLNTVLVPVYWDLIEPQEGVFDFSLVDGLIDHARSHDMRLVLLWFGSWKNSMSCYVPGWVKTDDTRFERARLKDGYPVEILSAFCQANLQADQTAFAALMRHIRQVDASHQTVIMVQVENEIGMLGEAREYTDAANAAFESNVPAALIEALQQNKAVLHPALKQRWKKKGFRRSGSWQRVFGKGLATDEIFMAWHYARYADAVAAAGKAEYALPMYVNAALNRPGWKPGRYPSAGPLVHVLDIWRAVTSAIDFFAPDIYFSEVGQWMRLYRQSGNPLFVPEIRLGRDNGAQAFYVIGGLDGLGFSPFSIESTDDPKSCPLAKSYEVLQQLSPLVLSHQGEETMEGVLLDKLTPSQTLQLGGYVLTVSHDYTWAHSGRDIEAETWPAAGGLVIAEGPGEYVIAGTGLIVTFAHPDASVRAGILSIEEGVYDKGQWIAGRRLSGDQSHQGRHLRIAAGQFGIQKIRLYDYR